MLPPAAQPPALLCAAPQGSCRSLPGLRHELAARVFTQLGWNWARAGGIAGSDMSIFFDERVEQRAGRWCLVLRMKPPFTGEVAHCGTAAQGRAGYAPGVLTWRGAGESICRHVAAQTGTPCGNNGVEILRTTLRRDAGQLHYRVLARRWVKARPDLAGPEGVPVEYENRTYRLSPDGSARELLRREWQLCGTRCVRLR